jgi:hypothetical protein
MRTGPPAPIGLISSCPASLTSRAGAPRDLPGPERKPRRAPYSNRCRSAADKPQASLHVRSMTAGGAELDDLATGQPGSSGQRTVSLPGTEPGARRAEIEFGDLRYFAAVAGESHLGRAAPRLHGTQLGLSQAVARARTRSRCVTSRKPPHMLIQEPRWGRTGPGQPGPVCHLYHRRVYRGRRQVVRAVRFQQPKPMADAAVTDCDLKVNANRRHARQSASWLLSTEARIYRGAHIGTAAGYPRPALPHG